MDIITREIDLNQAYRHFELLGKTEKNTVFLRAINDKNAIKLRGNQASSIKQFNNSGHGIYIVVNPGGQSDKDINAGVAVFYEHDDLAKEQQKDLWRSLNLPAPTFQIDTGGKSIHSYWVLDQPIAVSDWKILQTDLLDYADADRSIKNESRVMRLAGCYHQKTGEMAVISFESGVKYSYEELRKLIPTKSSISVPNAIAPMINIPVATGEAPPLEIFISKENRALLNGVPEGQKGQPGRNNAGCKLAKDLFGAESRLTQLGINFSDTAESLVRNFGDRCSPALPIKEIENIIKWASKNPEPSLTDEMLVNCFNGWKHRQGKIEKIEKSPIKERKIQAIATDDLKAKIAELLKQNFSLSGLAIKLAELAKEYQVSEQFVEKLYKALQTEEDRKDEAIIANQQINNFFKNTDSKLEIDKFLPGRLSVIGKLAEYMGLKPEVALLVLLATASSLLKPGSKVKLLDKTDFWQPLFIYAAIVANPGQRKSPLIRAIAKQPLSVLQYKAKLLYEKDLSEWKILERMAQENNKEAPPAPIRPLFFLEGFTQESLRSKVQQQPEKGILLLFDELSAESKNRNQYKGGKGSDKEDYLTRYDGFMRCEIRGEGQVVSESQPVQLPILGGIQPGVLAQKLGDQQDSAGEFARLTIAIQPDSPMIIGEDTPSLNLTEMLVSCYEKLAGLPQLDLFLSREAKQAFIKIHDKIERQRCSEEHPAIKGALSKLIGQIGRYAGIFHCLKMVEGQAENFEISVETVKLAVEFARWQMTQIRTLYSQSSEMSGCLLKILQLATRKNDWMKPRDIIQSIRQVKLTSAQVREHFQLLAELGYGEIRGGGISIEFKSFGKPVVLENKVEKIEKPPEPIPEEQTSAENIENSEIDEELADINFVESQLLSDEECIEQEKWEAENNPPKPENLITVEVGKKYRLKDSEYILTIKPSQPGDPSNTFRADHHTHIDKIFITNHFINDLELVTESKPPSCPFKIGDRVEFVDSGDRGEVVNIKAGRCFVEVNDKAHKIQYSMWEDFAGLKPIG